MWLSVRGVGPTSMEWLVTSKEVIFKLRLEG